MDVPGLIAVVIVAVIAPVIAARLLQRGILRQAAADRQATWDREDTKELARVEAAKEVARVQARAAAALAASQEKTAAAAEATRVQAVEAARLLVINNEAVAAGAARTDAKLDLIDAQAKRIHTLVNSDMTAARQSELDQTRAIVVVLERVIRMAVAAGLPPDPSDVEALDAAKRRIGELEAILADRMHQMREVQAEAALTQLTGGVQPEDGPGPLDASAANLNESAANLDEAAAHLTAAAQAHEGAQERLDDKTAALDDQAGGG